jgi:hypothetical protein
MLRAADVDSTKNDAAPYRTCFFSAPGTAQSVKRSAALLLGLALASFPAVSAGADDRSLREAGTSRDAQFERLGDQTRRTYHAWERSGHPRRLARRLLRLNQRTRREIDVVRAALRPEQPSSDGGATYKRLMFRSLRAFDIALVWDARGVRAHMRGRRGAARTAWRRAGRHFDRSLRLTRRAVRAIEG